MGSARYAPPQSQLKQSKTRVNGRTLAEEAQLYVLTGIRNLPLCDAAKEYVKLSGDTRTDTAVKKRITTLRKGNWVRITGLFPDLDEAARKARIEKLAATAFQDEKERNGEGGT